MGHQLKLQIYRFQLKSLNPYDKGEIKMQDFFEKNIGGGADLTKKELFRRFKEAYYQSFNGEFFKELNVNKSFGPVLNDLEFDENNNLFYGFLKGGPTGIEQELNDNAALNVNGQPIGKNKVVTLKYFFFIWMPFDVNYGVVMLQSYSTVNTGLGGPFFEHLGNFFEEYKLRIKKEVKVPKYIRDQFLKRGIVLGFDVLRKKVSKERRQRWNPNFVNDEKMKVRLSISGLSYGVAEFMEKFPFIDGRAPLQVDLSDIGMDNPQEYEAIIYYEDPITKKKASVKVNNQHALLPTIILDDNLKEIGKDYPNSNKILSRCKEELLKLKSEFEYVVND